MTEIDFRAKASQVIDEDLHEMVVQGKPYAKVVCAMTIKKQYEQNYPERHIHLDFVDQYRYVAHDIEAVLLNDDFQKKYVGAVKCDNGNYYSDDVLHSYYTDIDY